MSRPNVKLRPGWRWFSGDGRVIEREGEPYWVLAHDSWDKWFAFIEGRRENFAFKSAESAMDYVDGARRRIDDGVPAGARRSMRAAGLNDDEINAAFGLSDQFGTLKGIRTEGV